MESTCSAKHGVSYCTGPEDHNGPHGLFVGGMVIAPWDGATTEIQEETSLHCEYCDGTMLLSRHGRGGTFDCSTCDQFHDFSDRYGENLYHTSGPAARLYPAKMDRKTEIEFVGWQEKCFLLNQGMSLLLGEIDQKEHDERVAQCRIDVEARLRELAEPASWWRIFKRTIREEKAIQMGARGYNQDGTGGEIAVYFYGKRFALLGPSKFSYWLFNSWCRCKSK